MKTPAIAAALLLAALPATAAEVRLSAAVGDSLVQIVEDAPQAIRVTVNEKTVLDERRSQAVGLVNVYNAKQRWLLLLRQTSADASCPVSYRILDLGTETPSVSFPFGSCSEELEVAVEEGMLTVSMPGKATGTKSAWTYADGTLFRSR